jgi:hypothetical protein
MVGSYFNVSLEGIIRQVVTSDRFDYTVKASHDVTSIKQSPVLKGHLFLVLS